MSDFKLDYTASEINKRLGEMVKTDEITILPIERIEDFGGR